MLKVMTSRKDEVVCKCFNVTESQIRAQISGGKLTSVEKVTKACGAGGGCGSCHMLVQLFIDQERSRAGAVLPHGHAVNTDGKKSGFFKRIFRRGNVDKTLVKKAQKKMP